MRTIGRKSPNDSHLGPKWVKDRLLDPLLNILYRRKLLLQLLRQIVGNLIGADTHGLAHILEGVFRHQVVFALTEKQSDRWIVLILFHNPIYCGEIKVQLSSILRLEFTSLQLNHHIAAQV